MTEYRKQSLRRIMIAAWLTVTLAVLGLGMSRSYAASAIPKILNYQARVTDTSNVAVADGALDVKISIYDAASGGTCLYALRGTCGTPTAKSVTVTNGTFSTLIGDTGAGDNAIPDGLFDGDTRYLGITVGADPDEMTPRKRLAAAPYAFNADRLDDLDASSAGGTGAYIPATDSTGNLLLNGLLRVTNQNASPTSNLFQVQNSIDSARYLTVSSTNTTISYNLSGGASALTISDSTAPAGFLQLGDATVTANQYLPHIYGRASSTGAAARSGLKLIGDAGEDGSDDMAVIIQGRNNSGGALTTANTLEIWNSAQTALMAVGPTGNVGIGNDAPLVPLHVTRSSNGEVFRVQGTTNDFYANIQNATLSMFPGGIFDNPGASASFPTGLHAFLGTSSAHALSFRTSNVGRMVITSGGLVGIGTHTPEQTLHIFKGSAGTVTATTNAVAVLENSTSGYLNILTPDANESGVLFGSPTNAIAGGVIYNGASTLDGLQFRTNGNTTRMVVDASGNVGIGTTGPSAPLHIVTSAITPDVLLYDTTAGAAVQIDMANTSRTWRIASDSSPDQFTIGLTNTNGFLSIDPDGDVGIGTGIGTAGARLTVVATNTSPTYNLFQVQNSIDSSRYFTVSATSTVIGSASSTYAISYNARIGGNLTPSVDNTYSLGDYDRRWKDLWLSGGSANVALDTSGSSTLRIGFDSTFGNRAQLKTPTTLPIQITTGSNMGLNIDASGRVAIGTMIHDLPFRVDGAKSTDGSTSGQVSISDTTAYNANPTAGILFVTKFNSAGAYANFGGISVAKENATDGNLASFLALHTRPAGGSVTERLRIDSSGGMAFGTFSGVNAPPANGMIISGNVGIGMTAPGARLQVCGNTSCSAANAIEVGNDVILADYDTANSMSINGVSNSAIGSIRLGSGGGTISGSGGNIGIGDTSPDALLDVGDGIAQTNLVINGNGSASYNGLVIETSGTQQWFIGRNGTGSNDDLIFRADSATDVLRMANSGAVADTLVLSGGLVGIGTTPSGSPLHIVKNVADGTGIIKAEGSEPDVIFNQTGTDSWTTFTFRNDGVDKVLFGKNVNDDFYFSRNDGSWHDETMVIQRLTGNVSIGAPAPGARLTVADGLVTPTTNLFEVQNSINSARYFTVSSTRTEVRGIFRTYTPSNGDEFRVYVESGGAGYSEAYLKGQSTAIALYANPQVSDMTGSDSLTYSSQSAGIITPLNTPLVLGTNRVERARISALGDFGIGTRSPSAKLTVADNNAVPTGNIFQVQNSVDSVRYLTVSSTATLINPNQGVTNYPFGIGTSTVTSSTILDVVDPVGAPVATNIARFAGHSSAGVLIEAADTSGSDDSPFLELRGRFSGSGAAYRQQFDVTGHTGVVGTGNVNFAIGPYTAMTFRQTQNSPANVGINTASPIGQLEVTSAFSTFPAGIFTGPSGITRNIFDVNDAVTGLRFGVSSTSTQVFGKLGVGTGNPTSHADWLAGRVLHVSDTSSNLPHIRITSTGGELLLGADNTNAYIYSQSASGAIKLGTNNTEQVRILASGDVGIGVAAPDARLVVADGNVTPTRNVFEVQNSINSARYLSLSATSGLAIRKAGNAGGDIRALNYRFYDTGAPTSEITSRIYAQDGNAINLSAPGYVIINAPTLDVSAQETTISGGANSVILRNSLNILTVKSGAAADGDAAFGMVAQTQGAASGSRYGQLLDFRPAASINGITETGLRIAYTDQGTVTGTARGLDVDLTGLTAPKTHVAAIFRGGDVGIGTATPGARLTVSASETSPIANIFEVQNSINSARYLSVSSTATTVANLIVSGSCTGCSTSTTLNGAYLVATGTPQISLSPSKEGLMIQDTVGGLGSNLFEIRNRLASDDWSAKYLTVSSTGASISNNSDANSPALTVTSNIGTAVLKVASTGSNPAALRLHRNASGNYWQLVDDTVSAEALDFTFTSGATTNRMRLTTAGKLGINLGSVSPQAGLELRDTLVSPTGNIFQVSNSIDSIRYMTVSTTNTALYASLSVGGTATVNSGLAVGPGADAPTSSMLNVENTIRAHRSIFSSQHMEMSGGSASVTPYLNGAAVFGNAPWVIKTNGTIAASMWPDSSALFHGTLANPNGGLGHYENYLAYSQQFDQAVWTNTSLTTTANSATAPDGSVTASLLVATANGGNTEQFSTAGAAASNSWTGHVWLKTLSGTKNVALRVTTSGGDSSTSATGTVTTEWQRFAVNQAFTGSAVGTAGMRIGMDQSGDQVLVWGAQLEKQASSYGAYLLTTANAFPTTSRGFVGNGTNLFTGGVGINALPSAGTALTVAASTTAPTSNIFEIQNAINSARYLSISSTSAALTYAANTTEDAASITAAALTTGAGLRITAGGTTALTTGSLLALVGPSTSSTGNSTGALIDARMNGNPGSTNSAAAVRYTLNGITGGNAEVISVNGLTNGRGQLITTSSNVMNSGTLSRLQRNSTNVTTAYTGSLSEISSDVTQTSSGSPNHTGNLLDVSRLMTVSGASSAPTVSGAVAEFSDNAAVTLGSLTHTAPVVSITQNYAATTGSALSVTSLSTVGNAAFISGAFTPLTVASNVIAPAYNLFEARNAIDSARYLTVSATSTLLGINTDGTAVTGYELGIGTADPQATLHAVNAGSEQLRLESTGTPARLRLVNNAGTTYNNFIGADTLGASNVGLIFQTGNGSANTRMSIDVNGNVGIGTTTPGARLSVADDNVTPTSNIFQVQNSIDSSRYFSVSSTSTMLARGTGMTARVDYDTSATTTLSFGWNNTNEVRARMLFADKTLQISPASTIPGLYMDKFGRLGIGTTSLTAAGTNIGSGILQIDAASSTQRSMAIRIPSGALVNTFEIIDDGTVDVSVDRFGALYALNTFGAKALPGDTNFIIQVGSGARSLQFKPRNGNSSTVAVLPASGMSTSENLMQFRNLDDTDIYTRFDRLGRLVFGATNTDPTALLTVASSTAQTLFLDIRNLTADGGYTARYLTVSSTATIVGGDLLPSAAPTIGASSQTGTLLDNASANTGIRPSVVIGTDGFPVIAYHDETNGDLKVIKCGNAACSSGNTTTTVDSTGDVGDYSSIAIGTDGLPVISYQDNVSTDSDLKVVKCGNAACSSGNTVSTAYATGDVGWVTSIAIGIDGLPIISFTDNTSGGLYVTHCGDAACSSSNTTTLQDSNGLASSSIAIGTDGMPVIAFRGGASFALAIRICTTITCSAGSTTLLEDAANILANYVKVMIGQDGTPSIAYSDASANDVKFAKCNNAKCSSTVVIGTLSSTDNVGDDISMDIGADGLPVISYLRRVTDASDLRVIKCGNDSCGSGNIETAVETTNDVGFDTALAIGTDGLPFIAHYDNTNDDLRSVKCADPGCEQTTGGSTTGGSNLGSLGKYFNDVFANSFWGKQFQIEGFDLAESYRVDDRSISAGDLVIISASSTGLRPTVEKSRRPYQAVLGVISTKPGIKLSDWTTSPDGRLVALSGRVPTKVTDANGPILPNDPITASSIPGVGMKSTEAGAVVGYALEAWSGPGEGVIEIFINPTYSLGAPSIAGIETGPELTVGGPEIEDFHGAVLGGVAAILSPSGLWKVTEDGYLIAQRVEAKTVMAEEFKAVRSDDGETTGEGVIQGGRESAVIHNASITTTSRIFVSFRANPNSADWIDEVVEGGFTLRLAAPAPKDLPFIYWILNVEDRRSAPVPTAEPAVAPAPAPAEPAVPVVDSGSSTPQVFEATTSEADPPPPPDPETGG